MIRYYTFSAFLLFHCYAAWGQKGYAPSDTESFSVSTHKIGKITKILVIEPLVKSDYNPDEDCSDFKMTPKYAKYFFKNSVKISGNSFGHDYVYSSCSSNGRIEFSNGYVGTWTILRYGRGMLSVKKGNVKVPLIYLYCRKCDAIDNR